MKKSIISKCFIIFFVCSLFLGIPASVEAKTATSKEIKKQFEWVDKNICKDYNQPSSLVKVGISILRGKAPVKYIVCTIVKAEKRRNGW